MNASLVLEDVLAAEGFPIEKVRQALELYGGDVPLARFWLVENSNNPASTEEVDTGIPPICIFLNVRGLSNKYA